MTDDERDAPDQPPTPATDAAVDAHLPTSSAPDEAPPSLPASLASLPAWLLLFAALLTVGGVPLLLAPQRLAAALGMGPVDPTLPRLAGAALLAVATQAFRARRAVLDVTAAVLVQGIWLSAATVLAMLIAIAHAAPAAAWGVLDAAIVCLGANLHFRVRLRQWNARARAG